MDWSKTKTILILAFLTLNLFLGYQVYLSKLQHGVESESAQNTQWEIENYLSKQNITLKMDIPQETPLLNYLYVEYVTSSTFEQEEMADQQVVVDNTVLESRLEKPVAIRDFKSPKDVLNQLHNTIKFADQYKEDVNWTLSAPVYWQMHDGLPMFVAPLELHIADGFIRGYKQTYLLVKNQGSGRKIITAYTALRSLIEKEVIKSGESIDSISLGYYGFKYDAEIQVLAPVWRFQHGNKVEYMNGFTGTMERPLDKRGMVE
ncbi:two-component system regulatory protein YycI [Brevibacillus laterosporus]